MRILQVVDVLRHKLIRLEVDEDQSFVLKEYVLVQCERELLVAKVLGLPRVVPGGKIDGKYKFNRRLKLDEIKSFLTAQEGEKARILKAQDLVSSLKLEMKIFASNVGWQEKIVSLFFTSENPVDFRELLKVLVKAFPGRVHLERVGARDRAKIIGGFGSCGQETCCTSFKVRLESVPMDAVRDQGIVMKDNEKVLGLCGKLKCCLLYELSSYKSQRRYLPHIKQIVTLPDKKRARVIGLDILNKKEKVIGEDAHQIEIFSVSDLVYENKKESSHPEEIASMKAKEIDLDGGRL